VDGGILPESPFCNGAPALSAKVPLPVGSTRTEIAVGWDWPKFESFTNAELTGVMTKAYGKEKGLQVLEAFRRRHPGAKPCDLFAPWQSSVFAGRHSVGCDAATGGGAAARALAAKVSEAWIHFARTGNPNHSGLPKWPAFRAGKDATMVFDNVSAVAHDADREELNLLASL
jgi:para-nitrobenzyl esterase